MLLLGAWIVQGSNSFQSCLQGDTEQFDDASFVRLAAAQTSSSSAVECLGDFLDANEPTIVALAMVVVAGFTWTLSGATKKMQRSAEQLARTAEETAQRQLRAYVSGMPQIVFAFDETRAPRVQLKIHNSGATPAYEVRYRASVTALARQDLRLPSLNTDFSALGVLFPNAELRDVAAREATFDQAAIVALRDGTASLYCYGEIDYVDAFTHPHTTRFCHEIFADGETMLKLTSFHSADDFKLEFRIAPFGNAAN